PRSPLVTRTRIGFHYLCVGDCLRTTFQYAPVGGQSFVVREISRSGVVRWYILLYFLVAFAFLFSNDAV
ncbi:hypothetical protein GALMADRAFT_264345, partial [Galerina marginata CBS 339.88]